MICLLPSIIIFGLFNIFPVLYSGYLGLNRWDGLKRTIEFIGIQNYRDIIKSIEFWNSMKVTFYYMVGITFFGIAAGLIIALLLNRKFPGQTIFRTIYFTPVITSTIAAAIVWKYLFDPGSGYINTFLRFFRVPGPGWLTSPTWAMPVIITMGVWKRLGFNMVIYLAGLQSISPEYYEVAQVDGAGSIVRFFRITLPLISPITGMLVIMSVIDSFLVFDQIFVMTNGGPLHSTDVIGLLLYRNAFRYFKLGYSSAIGMIIFMVIFIITFLQRRFLSSGEKALW
ncbi:MAG: sugar ABC transporter permease [Spirochaetes bacterium]|nr:MAG: sugar ABC transporter permease [Spirochaetota bacterium]